MILDALAQYVASLTAFWVSLASGGLMKLLVIGAIIYWFCFRRRRCGRRWRRHRRTCGCGPGCGCGPSGWDDWGPWSAFGCHDDGPECPRCDCVCGGCGCHDADGRASGHHDDDPHDHAGPRGDHGDGGEEGRNDPN